MQLHVGLTAYGHARTRMPTAMMKSRTSSALTDVTLTATIVAAFASNNTVASKDLPAVITCVYNTLAALKNPMPEIATEPPAAPKPAVPIRKSVTLDHIICLEDGRKLKMLRRHLRETYGMTPEDYRRKWGLPGNYPMVAPNYAMQRSAHAKSVGLGRHRKVDERAA